MGYEEGGEIQTFNASKAIAQERDLKLIIWHSNAMKQARIGETELKKMDEMSDNERKMNQVRALNVVISAQRELISISRSQIRWRARNKWKNQYREEKEREENPFEKEENDYSKLISLKNKLEACELDIIEADKTASLEDDFLIEREKDSGVVYELTDNFREMLMELEDSYEDIHLLMLINKIISAGLEQDEELSYKEKEEEVIRRITEA